ncbi:MAG TPA: hypothetical protein VGN19_00280, partial [Pedococcus sp.]|nr:hypothetical protein [Pedococcus sp.]
QGMGRHENSFGVGPGARLRPGMKKARHDGDGPAARGFVQSVSGRGYPNLVVPIIPTITLSHKGIGVIGR